MRFPFRTIDLRPVGSTRQERFDTIRSFAKQLKFSLSESVFLNSERLVAYELHTYEDPFLPIDVMGSGGNKTRPDYGELYINISINSYYHRDDFDRILKILMDEIFNLNLIFDIEMKWSGHKSIIGYLASHLYFQGAQKIKRKFNIKDSQNWHDDHLNWDGDEFFTYSANIKNAKHLSENKHLVSEILRFDIGKFEDIPDDNDHYGLYWHLPKIR